MDGSDDLPGSDSDMVVDRGGTYDHAEYGQVEVTGIWKGVKQVNEAQHTNEGDVIIVRYSAEISGKKVDELTDTLEDFLQSIQ